MLNTKLHICSGLTETTSLQTGTTHKRYQTCVCAHLNLDGHDGHQLSCDQFLAMMSLNPAVFS